MEDILKLAIEEFKEYCSIDDIIEAYHEVKKLPSYVGANKILHGIREWLREYKGKREIPYMLGSYTDPRRKK